MLFLLALAAAGADHPTYLRCSFDRPGGDIYITADEPNSSVTVAVPSTGFSEKLQAAFTPTEVRFQNRQLSYVLSRTDLSVARTIKLLSSVDNGKCAIEQAPKRAF